MNRNFEYICIYCDTDIIVTPVQVELTEKWAEMYKEKGVSFYSMHPGWAETPGVAKSLHDFSKSYANSVHN